jgi:anthranilate phosphoribosyltransferase
MIRQAIETILNGADLKEPQAASVMEEIMDGKASAPLVSAYLVALRAKGESVDELVGSARVMRSRSLAARLGGIGAVDMCGTGGDGKSTFNISTTAAFVVAGAGIPVAKHGNRAASSRCGSADLLEALGADLSLDNEQVVSCLKRVGIGFFFAPRFHPAMRNVAPVRKELGLRTIFNVLGPLTNPAGVRSQLLGVFSEELVLPMAEVLKDLGADSACVVHGLGGWDEATTVSNNVAAVLRNGSLEKVEIDPRRYGLPRARSEDLEGGSPGRNAEITLRILSGDKGPARDTTLLNAGLALVVGKGAPDLPQGLRLAAESIDSGRARSALAEFVACTRAAGGGAP